MDVRTRAKRAVLRVYPRAGEVRRVLAGAEPTAVKQQHETLKERDRRRARQLDNQAHRLDNQAQRLDLLEQQVVRDGRRISELEAELQEARRLNKRIAELTDVVAEVLLPEERRDDARIRARLADYDRSLHASSE